MTAYEVWLLILQVTASAAFLMVVWETVTHQYWNERRRLLKADELERMSRLKEMNESAVSGMKDMAGVMAKIHGRPPTLPGDEWKADGEGEDQ